MGCRRYYIFIYYTYILSGSEKFLFVLFRAQYGCKHETASLTNLGEVVFRGPQNRSSTGQRNLIDGSDSQDREQSATTIPTDRTKYNPCSGSSKDFPWMVF